MQARISLLRDELNRLNNEEALTIPLGDVGRLYHSLHLHSNILNQTDRSELQRQEECDALVFFTACIQFIYAKEGNFYLLPGPGHVSPSLQFFLDKLVAESREADNTTRCLEENYNAMIEWGLYFLDLYQQERASPSELNSNYTISPRLKAAATDAIFENPASYKAALQEEKARRYREYVGVEHADGGFHEHCLRELKKTLFIRNWGTALCFIPGVFLFAYGLPATWNYLRDGHWASAIFIFIFAAVCSAISPFGALIHYSKFNLKAEQQQAVLERIHQRVYTEDQFTAIKSQRTLLKKQLSEEKQAETPSILPPKLFCKPKKQIERFIDTDSIKKVRVLGDQAQVGRLDALQDFATKRRKRSDAAVFLKTLPKSRQESMEIAKLAHREYEEFKAYKL